MCITRRHECITEALYGCRSYPWRSSCSGTSALATTSSLPVYICFPHSQRFYSFLAALVLRSLPIPVDKVKDGWDHNYVENMWEHKIDPFQESCNPWGAAHPCERARTMEADHAVYLYTE